MIKTPYIQIPEKKKITRSNDRGTEHYLLIAFAAFIKGCKHNNAHGMTLLNNENKKKLTGIKY